MASIESEVLAKVRDLLGAGRVSEANTAVAEHFAAQPPAAPPAADDPAAPAAPRDAQSVIVDLFDAIVSHLGAPPALTGLLEELFSVVGL